jgi:hypothetical protein
MRWRRQLLEQSRDKGIVCAQEWYGIFPLAAFALLVGVKLKDVPPGIGTRQERLAKYRLTGHHCSLYWNFRDLIMGILIDIFFRLRAFLQAWTSGDTVATLHDPAPISVAFVKAGLSQEAEDGRGQIVDVEFWPLDVVGKVI